MNILFLTNNTITNDLIVWLKSMSDLNIQIYSQKLELNKIKRDQIELIISYNYKYLINKEVINFFKGKIINLHISLLPWNRGADPNVWSFLENTPKGVTIHLVDEGLDTGDIIYQKEIIIYERKETLSSSYILLHKEIQKLFRENWEAIKTFNFIPKKQIGKGSCHNKKDFKEINSILDEKGWGIPIVELKKNYSKMLNN